MFHDFLRSRRGSISVLAAGAFCALLAVAALVVEGAALYVTKVRQQRTADLAMLAAGNLFGAVSNGTASAAAIATAQNIATINGFSAASTTVSTSDGGTKLNVAISSTSSFGIKSMFAPLNSAVSLSRATGAPAVNAMSCVLSLTGEVALAGNAVVTGPDCGVTANTYLLLGASGIDVKAATVGTTASVEASRVVSPTVLSPPLDKFKYGTPAIDGLANEAVIAGLTADLAMMQSGWPHPTSSPVTVTSASTNSGPGGNYVNTTAFIGKSARIGALTVSNSTLTFAGSGSPDSNCFNPTTIDGDTKLSGNSTLILNSGCYIFEDNVTLTDASTVTIRTTAGARVRFIFGGTIINKLSGKLVFPAGTYSIAGGLSNLGGGSFTFGAGPKVIGGVLDNGIGITDLGAGPFYLPSTNVRQSTGNLKFGSGPFYMYGATLTNGGSGTMTFGAGPYYIYNSTISNGEIATGGAPRMIMESGPYYVYRSSIALVARSATVIGAGDMDLYGSVMLMNGTSVSFGREAPADTGVGTIRLAGGSFSHVSGSLVANGITIAQNSGTINLTGSDINITAPTAANPTAGIRNLLIYSVSGTIRVAPSDGDHVLGGVIYAPAATVEVSGARYAPSAQSCLTLVGGYVRIIGAAIAAKPCSNFPGLVGPGLRATLGG